MAFNFFKNVIERFSGAPVDWDDLEEALIRADFGITLTTEIIAQLREGSKPITAETVTEITKETVLRLLLPPPLPLRPLNNGVGPTVILVVGVNGTGKTTSTAKLAAWLKRQGHSVLLAAADTFRAAATEQLAVWADRLEVGIVKGKDQSDPSALCFEAQRIAIRDKIDFLICDTAGRLHTKNNLMQELEKMKRTLGKQDSSAPHEAFLVADATTGSNALNQAREFHKAVGLTGLIVTKLDGSGKGGGLVSIRRELGVPTRFIGTGETLESLAPFDPKKFVETML